MLRPTLLYILFCLGLVVFSAGRPILSTLCGFVPEGGPSALQASDPDAYPDLQRRMISE
jgi:hypothetical protein